MYGMGTGWWHLWVEGEKLGTALDVRSPCQILRCPGLIRRCMDPALARHRHLPGIGTSYSPCPIIECIALRCSALKLWLRVRVVAGTGSRVAASVRLLRFCRDRHRRRHFGHQALLSASGQSHPPEPTAAAAAQPPHSTGWQCDSRTYRCAHSSEPSRASALQPLQAFMRIRCAVPAQMRTTVSVILRERTKTARRRIGCAYLRTD
jgi:hypothetical protein